MSAPEERRDDDGVVERDGVENRYVRYNEQIGRGRFKAVYRGFDEKEGKDVAWAKIDGTENRLTQPELEQVLKEVKDGQRLKHDNVINYYLAWPDYDNKCINFITELFTSGNLRDYRRKHKHMGIKALKKWARQLLDGIHYLHTQADGPLVHGDLRCDKIYINGHTGGIKIGDLGLATLLERRYKEKAESGDYSMLVQQSKTQADVYCFGLCMLELMTLQPLDPSNALAKSESLLEEVTDQAARKFLLRCLTSDAPTPTAEDLMKDPFLEPAAGGPGERSTSGLNRSKSDVNKDRSLEEETGEACQSSDTLKSALGSIRGDEWHFAVNGVQQGTGIFTLKLMMRSIDGDEQQGERSASDCSNDCLTLQFDYDPNSGDNPQRIVDELAQALPEMGRGELTSIDRDMCRSALKECINKIQ